jgi:hypothetical protein
MKKNIKIVITRKNDLNELNEKNTINLPEIKRKEEKTGKEATKNHKGFLLKLYNFYSKNRLYIFLIIFFIIYIYNKPA